MMLPKEHQLHSDSRRRRSRSSVLSDRNALKPRVMKALGMIQCEPLLVSSELRNMLRQTVAIPGKCLQVAPEMDTRFGWMENVLHARRLAQTINTQTTARSLHTLGQDAIRVRSAEGRASRVRDRTGSLSVEGLVSLGPPT